jgi:hypothetical protein
MRKMRTAVSTLVLSALGATATAAELQIPNTFQANTPAKAEEVNANFEAIRQAVNAMQAGNGSCAGADEGDVMVRVGPICVDKFEASVWPAAAGGAEGSQFGTAADDYPCFNDGSNCSTGETAIYARSQEGVTPSSAITWFQAQQACANSGKRLLTNAEWQMAVAGTPDDVTASGDCTMGGGVKSLTGAQSRCVSTGGVADMVGNVWEWTADWMQGRVIHDASTAQDEGATQTGNGFGNDQAEGIHDAAVQDIGTGFPGAVIRGGGYDASPADRAGSFAISAAYAPSSARNVIGFRCAK